MGLIKSRIFEFFLAKRAQFGKTWHSTHMNRIVLMLHTYSATTARNMENTGLDVDLSTHLSHLGLVARYRRAGLPHSADPQKVGPLFPGEVDWKQEEWQKKE